jgi:hypothetical protein
MFHMENYRADYDEIAGLEVVDECNFGLYRLIMTRTVHEGNFLMVHNNLYVTKYRLR